LSQQGQVVARPAAAIQNRRVGPVANRLGEKRRHEPPKAAEPEVVPLDAFGGYEQSIHRQVLQN